MVYDDDDEAEDWERFKPLLPRKPRPQSSLSKCLKCNAPQILKFDGTETRVGVYLWCPKCHYLERLN